MEEDTSLHMERIYRERDEADIPWHRPEPPAPLVELVRSGRVAPCRALDIGCGTGSYSLFLAREGFQVTGVDVSPSAIAAAREKARRQGVAVDFEQADMRADVSHVGRGFDFALEWMIMHHILPDERPRYRENLVKLLNRGALYLSVSFSSEDPKFGDPPSGAWRRSPLGPLVYCSGLGELEALFAPAFDLLESNVIDIPGAQGAHRVNYLLLRRHPR